MDLIINLVIYDRKAVSICLLLLAVSRFSLKNENFSLTPRGTDQRINSWRLIRREWLSNLRVLDGALIVISFGGPRFCGLVPGF